LLIFIIFYFQLTIKAPSEILSAEAVSSQKFKCPGQSNKFNKYDLSFKSGNIKDTGVAFKLKNLAFSSFLLSFYWNFFK